MRVRLTAAALFAAVSVASAAAAAGTVKKIVHQGIERRYEVRAPGGSSSGPRPLVIALHGHRQSLESLRG